jgi:uncharacterized protein
MQHLAIAVEWEWSVANTALHNNRLSAETSPYLLQHSHNPVDWWPWGPEALAEAQRSKRPILLSVGYAACHWCHVMAHESFEDEATAAVMNELFVNIKVDREERPDIDQIYMNALHHLGEQGGWPLTMFLTSEGAPFWGGTYFPKHAQYGRAAFADVLREVSRVFHREPEKIEQNRVALVSRLAQRARATGAVTLGITELDNAATSIARATDPTNGGLRGAPKFPQCAMLENLWRAGVRTRDERFFITTALALTQMSEGGIYDHLGGGYARYSVDERWLVPHFEKMLYDNAQILDLLALDFTRTANPLYRQRAEQTVGWLLREMTTPNEAFASSLDADSEGEEGKFYVWSLDEMNRLLPPDDARHFATIYDVTAEGNFEGHSILNRLGHIGVSAEEDEKLAAMRVQLLAERSHRVRPGLDDKVLADWNGLMIAALAHAANAFGKDQWLVIARAAFDGVVRSMTSRDGDDRLGHSWRGDKLVVPGLASDYAAMIRAGLALYEATADAKFLDQAIRWQHTLDRHYHDAETGSYFLTADDAEGLIIRPHSTVDDAIPNHCGLIAQNLVRLAHLAGDPHWASRRDSLFTALLPRAAENVFGHLSLLNGLDLYLTGAEIVVTGEGEAAQALLATARRLPHATTIVQHAATAAALATDHPARAMIDATAGQPAAFLCRGQACSRPVTTPAELLALATGA